MKISEYIKFDANNKAFLKVKITPKSAKNELFSILDDGTLKIRIKAVPENNKANKELISFIRDELKIKKSDIEIVSGSTEQTKTIRISI